MENERRRGGRERGAGEGERERGREKIYTYREEKENLPHSYMSNVKPRTGLKDAAPVEGVVYIKRG